MTAWPSSTPERRGEPESCVNNFCALLKIAWPLIYGNLFAAAALRSRPMLGAPYFLMSGIILTTQGLLQLIDPKDFE